jgi:hypothetical protein
VTGVTVTKFEADHPAEPLQTGKILAGNDEQVPVSVDLEAFWMEPPL